MRELEVNEVLVALVEPLEGGHRVLLHLVSVHVRDVGELGCVGVEVARGLVGLARGARLLAA